ncbi:MAG: hypothetical protein M1816_001890 [Peltula sp. TS41687]|nr:MAG: hypothetical protein M1816_001890 [Peltula sp. TS41687]
MAGNPYRRTSKPDRVERISEEQEAEVAMVEGKMGGELVGGTTRAKKPQVRTGPVAAQPVVIEYVNKDNRRQHHQPPASRNWHPISEYYEDDYSTNDDEISFADAEEGRATSPPVTAGQHPSLVEYRQVGHGRIVENQYSGPPVRDTHLQTQPDYKPYRKVERVLGVKVTPTKSGLLEIEHTIDPAGSRKDDEETELEVLIPNPPEKDVQHSEARRPSLRSQGMPLRSHPVQISHPVQTTNLVQTGGTGNGSTAANLAPRRSSHPVQTSSRFSQMSLPVETTQLLQTGTGNGTTTSNAAPRSKRVSYEIPPIDLTKPMNFSRQKITTTPYPRSKPLTPRISVSASSGNEHGLVLCLYGHNQSFPRYTRLTIPFHEKKDGPHQPGAKNNKISDLDHSSFDDEQLFLLMRKQYKNFRGPLRRLFSMQRLKSLNAISWTPSFSAREDRRSMFHLTNRPAISSSSSSSSTTPSQPESESESASASQQMFELFTTPKRGKGRYEWIDWAHKTAQELAENSLDGAEEVAVEFVEGWSVWRIVSLTGAVWLLSLAAGTLWVILGVDPDGRRGWHTAGARVSTGVLFSGVVLMLGWSLVAAWALLSWLTG